MKILITGAAGFIGFHLAQNLLKKKVKVIGIDNINNYYSPKLKKLRLQILKKHKNFTFYKSDITKLSSLKKIFKNNKSIDIIYHLAAQAGVRYSVVNPKKYFESNIVGFFNILECCKDFRIKKLFYASSSSVYGDLKKFPLNEKMNINPKNFYALSKKTNEEMAEVYSKLYGFNAIGLRFFTVFGEYGRPDMFIFKLLRCSIEKKIFELNNFGNHIRDFTYIRDVINLVTRIKVKNKISNQIFNICSSKPVHLKKMIKIISLYVKLPRIKKVSFQKADVIKTHGDNKKILKNTKFNKFTNINKALKNTIDWYKSHNI
jgi:UDP-glucuronate 4-epimerase